jgi:hypothetical protein
MLPDKHIQLSTGFTQDSFGITSTTVNKWKFYVIGTVVQKNKLVDYLGNVFSLLNGKHLDLMKKCSWLAEYINTVKVLLTEKFLVPLIILHSDLWLPAKGTEWGVHLENRSHPLSV